MFCSKCGSQLPDNSSFCPVCGARVNGSGEGMEVHQQPVNTPTQNPMPQNAPTPNYMPPQKNNTKMILILVIAVIAVLLALILALVIPKNLGNGGKQENVSSQARSDTGKEKSEEKSEVSVSEEKSQEKSSEEKELEKKGKYWYETTKVPLDELDKDYEMESAVRDSATNAITGFGGKTTMHMSSFMSDRDDTKGTMKTIIIAQNTSNITALKQQLGQDVYISNVVTPVDMYTGKLLESYLDESDLANYTGKEHKITINVDGKKYNISWHQETKESGDEQTTMIYITHPIEYNGVGCLIAAPISNKAKSVEFQNYIEEAGGYSKLSVEDYYDHLTTPYVIDCRDTGE